MASQAADQGSEHGFSPLVVRRLLRRHELGLALAIVVAVAVTGLIDPQHNYFYDPALSAQNILRQASLLGIFALGSAVVIIAGGIDLSSGSVIAFSGTVCATLILLLAPEQIQSGGVPSWVLCVAGGGALLTGFFIGALHAWLVIRTGLPPFVATLATLVGLRSFARAMCQGMTEAVRGSRSTQIQVYDEAFRYLGSSTLVPLALFVALTLGTWVLLARTVLGRHLYALGGNEQAARLCGIRTDRLKWFAYVFSAVLSSLAGVLYVGFESAANPQTMGRGYELNAIASAVVGGCSLQGGVGTAPGVALGAVFLHVVIDAVNKIIKTGADVYQGLIVGAVVVLAVALTQPVGEEARREGLFRGPLGWTAVLTLSLLAGTFAAVAGPDFFQTQRAPSRIWLGLGTAAASAVILGGLGLLGRSRLRRAAATAALLGVLWLLQWW